MAKKPLPTINVSMGAVIGNYPAVECAACGRLSVVYGVIEFESNRRKWSRPPMPLCEACFHGNGESVLIQKVFPGLEITKAHESPRTAQ